MKTRTRTRHSIDHMIKILFFSLLPVVIVDALISFYVMSSLSRQAIQSLQDTVSLYVSQLDTVHISVNKYLIRCLDREDVKKALETESSLELIQSAQKISQDVTEFLESFDSGYQFFFYNKQNGRFLRPNGVYETMTKDELDSLNNELLTLMQKTDPVLSYTDAWEILSTPSGVYFYKVFHSEDHYAGCCISADLITAPLKSIHLGHDGFIFLTDRHHTPLTNADKLGKLHIGFSSADSHSASVYSSGQNLVLAGELTMGVFCPHIILKKRIANERILVLQFLISGTVLLIAGILFCSIFYMKRRILKPLKEFSENLARLDHTTDFINLQDSKIIELENANLQFKKLMNQIKSLKIRIYEKELEKQNIYMDYLQLQIRPHFFLNCLNTIYSMAQTQLYEEIMELSVIISDYFRYIFKNRQQFVTVQSELEHVENYMKIQKLRYADRFTYEIYAEEGTGQVQILPILIQTFIENSIRYSAMLEDTIHIRIEVCWAQAGANTCGNIHIQITDNGPGFPADILAALNDTQSLEPLNGRRIGITNAVKRLWLFYSEGDAAITFSNLPAKGACVTILLLADESHRIP